MKIQGFILYKLYYGDVMVYLGRTKQSLQDRIRGHLFKKPMHRAIDINLVTKIEYAIFSTEADMNIYEIYLINKLKPMLNVDDKTGDEPTITLPEVDFIPFECHLWDKWKQEINCKNDEFHLKADRYKTIHQDFRVVRSQFKTGEITEDEYMKQLDKLHQDERELKKYLYG